MNLRLGVFADAKLLSQSSQRKNWFCLQNLLLGTDISLIVSQAARGWPAPTKKFRAGRGYMCASKYPQGRAGRFSSTVQRRQSVMTCVFKAQQPFLNTYSFMISIRSKSEGSSFGLVISTCRLWNVAATREDLHCIVQPHDQQQERERNERQYSKGKPTTITEKQGLK